MKVDPRFANVADASAARQGAPAPVAPRPALLPPRAAPLVRPLAPRPGLHAELEWIVGAQGLDASLFTGTRPDDILEDVLVRILPTLDLDGETRLLAVGLLREEIDTRQALELQRAQAQLP